MSVRPRSALQAAAITAIWLFAALTARAQRVDLLHAPDIQLEPVSFADLAGWTEDDQATAFAAFMASCRPLLAGHARRNERPIRKALRSVCRRAAHDAHAIGTDRLKAREFFEQNFEPVRVARLGESTGLLTGYYEPVVDGSRFPNPEFSTPVYRRPRDLVVNGHKPHRGAISNRATIGRYNSHRKLEPYYDRGAIEAGALDGRHLEICWVRNPFVAMAIQIQGSARIRLEDGTMLRINYDAHNGYSYTSIGRILVDRNLVPREEMSMERLRQWMTANPDQAVALRAKNKAFVFFRITGLDSDAPPVGGQGIPLTAGRSIAVDRMHVYGTPFFIQAQLPIESARANTPFRRLMVAQDTGSAIVGPARADLYFGSGKKAGEIAGRIRQQGRFVMLLPRALDLVKEGRTMPLPRPRPAAMGPKPPGSKAKPTREAGAAGKSSATHARKSKKGHIRGPRRRLGPKQKS